MKRTVTRVELISSCLERRRKSPIHPMIVVGESHLCIGMPPFDPETGAKA